MTDDDLAARLRSKLGLKNDGEQDDVEDVENKEGVPMDDEDDEEEEDDEDEEKAEDLSVEEVAQAMAKVTELSPEEAVSLLESAGEDPDEGELKSDDEEEEEPSFEEKLDERLDEVLDERVESVVESKLEDREGLTEEDLESKLDDFVTEEDVESKLDSVAEVVGEEVDDVMQKADFSTTPDPSTDEESSVQKVGDIFGGEA